MHARNLQMKPITLAVLAALAGSAFVSARASGPAPGAKVGSETLINPVLGAPAYWNSLVAMDAAGDYVVTWSDYYDGQYEVLAQRYHADGTSNGGEILVNNPSTGIVSSAVAMDPAGDFVVFWETASSGPQFDIFGQMYDSSGSPVGSAFQVDTTSSDRNELPSVAMDSAGDFTVTWNNSSYAGAYLGENYNIFAQRFDNSGARVGSEFEVNTTADEAGNPHIAMDAAGDSVIVWTNDPLGSPELKAQRYDHTGATQGSEFEVNTTSIVHNQSSPALAMDATGDFIVAYQSSSTGSPVFAKRFDNTGVVQGSEFKVSTNPIDFGTSISVAMDAAGEYVVAWSNEISLGDGSYNDGVYANRYQADGTDITGEFLVSPNTTSSDQYPLVLMDSAGDFVETWYSYPDLATHGIYAQEYARESSIDLDLTFNLAPFGTIAKSADLTLTASVANNESASTLTGNPTIDGTLTTATGVTVDFSLPSDVTFVSATGTNWVCGDPVSGVVTCTFGSSLAAAASTTDDLTVQVTAPAVESLLQFSASVSGNQPDATATNDTVTAEAITGQAPVTAAAALAVDRNTTKTGKLKATDADGDGLTFSKVQNPSHGTLTVNSTGSFSYKPAAGYVGKDKFTYKAYDGVLYSNVSTDTVTVTEHTPVATALSFSMTHNTVHKGQLKGSDADKGDVLKFSKATNPAHGTLTVATNGTFTYTPTHNYKGSDSFTFHVSDGLKTSTAAKVSIKVN